MPALPPSRLAVRPRTVLAGLALAAMVSGGWVLTHRAADVGTANAAGATGELTVRTAPGAASPNASGLRPLSGEVAALVPGEQSWVEIPWTSDASVCAVSVTVAADGATVAYPWTTKAFSSFSRENRLVASATDYTAVRVELPASTTTSTVPAEITARFTTGAGSSAGTCNGTTTTRTFHVSLPVRT